MTIGEKIKQLRESKQITQTELASVLKTTKQNIYKYETGIISNIPSDKIEIIANYFQVSPAYLMGWEESEWLIDPNVNNGYPVKRSMYKKTKEQEILSNLSTHEKAVIIAYHNQPEMQSAIDRILNIEEK